MRYEWQIAAGLVRDAPEERALTALFGTDFLAYQVKVRRWL
jgi:protein-S-isoprenylcysteine O-methyltransferase Ste14